MVINGNVQIIIVNQLPLPLIWTIYLQVELVHQQDNSFVIEQDNFDLNVTPSETCKRNKTT